MDYAASRPFDMNMDANSRQSWGDFTTFYQTQSSKESNFPIDNNSTEQSKHAEIFKNHGSKQSMDQLADEMGTKWSFNNNNSSDSNTDINNGNISKAIENNNDNDYKQKETLSKDEHIIKLTAYIKSIEDENKELKENNNKLKLRNGELRKQLNKAQQYRRKSSIALWNLKKANDKIQEAQTKKDSLQHSNNHNNNNGSEEKIYENDEQTEDDINKIIQDQIASAIKLFQDEFGAELEDGLNNIESFQYEELNSSDSGPEYGDNAGLYSQPQPTNLGGTKQTNTAKSKDNPELDAFKFDFGNQQQINWEDIKFTDANSEPKPNDVDDINDDTVLPSAMENETPGGPIGNTPAGPMDNNLLSQAKSRNSNVNNQQMIDLENRLNDLSEKLISYMNQVESLTERNQQLEISKLDLITSTSTAMNQYRDTIKNISHHNRILMNQIK